MYNEPVEPFIFAHLSDIHEPVGSGNFKAVIDDLNKNVKSDFTVVTGDVTNHGTPDQYQQYQTDLSAIMGKTYTAVGNHDVRWWNSNGKVDWINRIGPLYYSFHHKGVHFVVLDSTVELENDEKFGRTQLQWLQNDLSNISTETPVIFFAHHPFSIYDNVTGRDELLNLLKDYNVVAYLSGHEHGYASSVENGVLWYYITCIKDHPEYCKVMVTPDQLYIYKRHIVYGTQAQVLWLKAPMTKKRKLSISFQNVSAQPDGTVKLSVTADRSDCVSTVKARIDNYGPWTELEKNNGAWVADIRPKDYIPVVPFGKHFIGVNVRSCNNDVWKAYREYEWHGGESETKWIYQTGDIIQSSPTYFNGIIYAGSEDGKIYAISDNDGSLRWSFQTENQIISKPAVYQIDQQTLILVGSHDQKLYALDADKGTLVWTFQTEGSVLSDPLVDHDTVYFGSGDRYIYSLNAHDGSLRWKYQADGLMRQQPVVSNGILYAFVRDTYIWYAFHISDGSLYWRGNAATDESMFVCGDVRPILAGGKLWCIDAQANRAAYLVPDTGELLWASTDLGRVSARGPATDGKIIFYPADEGRMIYAIDAFDNTVKWTLDMKKTGDDDIQNAMMDCRLVCSGGILYHVAETGRITGLDPATGETKFVYDAVGYPQRALWSTPEVNGRNLYACGLDGRIYAVSYTGS